ncbi:hypothetical protein MTR67_024096 [Solanum verrucosum]|uniref:Uncharacterized protein n=1 Tax=Solanum verrucosum TaxID=315347 RepID=A0AAF0TSD4_SOLVR|nr:hypothetical protein MTR67_024096 [Solanum verrucosum]
MLLASTELLDKSIASTSIGGLEVMFLLFHLIQLLNYIDSLGERKSGIENVNFLDDAQSKLQSAGQKCKLERDFDILCNVKDTRPESQLAYAELLNKSLAFTSIDGLEGCESILLAYAELLDKSIASTTIGGLERSESMLLASTELLDKSIDSTSIGGLEGSDSMLLASAELLDKSIASTSIGGLEGSEPMLLASAELLDKSLALTSISGLEGMSLCNGF